MEHSLYEHMRQEQYFLGAFENAYYRITRKYLDAPGVKMRLYRTKIEPL
jgi:hypothetical protein